MRVSGIYDFDIINLYCKVEMSVPRGKAAPAPNNKNQPAAKKVEEVKPVKKGWAAEDYVSPSVSV